MSLSRVRERIDVIEIYLYIFVFIYIYLFILIFIYIYLFYDTHNWFGIHRWREARLAALSQITKNLLNNPILNNGSS